MGLLTRKRVFAALILSLSFYRFGDIRTPWFTIYLPQTMTLLLLVMAGKLKPLGKTPLAMPLLGFLLICGLSVFQSAWVPEHPEAYPLLNWSARNTPYVKSLTQILWIGVGISAYFLTELMTPDRASALKTVKLWLGAQAIAAALSMVQLMGNTLQIDALKSFFRGVTTVAGLEYSGRSAYRVTSVFTEPSHLAVFHACLLPLAIHMVTGRTPPLIRRHWLFALLLMASFACTLSRTTMLLGTFLTAALIVRRIRDDQRSGKRRERTKSIVTLLVLLVGGELIARYVLNSSFVEVILFQITTFSNASNISNVSRLISAGAAWDIFMKHPLLGAGIGNYAMHLASVLPWEQLRFAMPIVGNIYLEILAETGLFGISAFIWVLWSAHRFMKRAIARCESQDDRAILEDLLMGYHAMLVGFLTFSAFFFPFTWCYIGTMLGLARVLSRPQVISQVRDVVSAKLQEPPRSAVIHGEQPR